MTTGAAALVLAGALLGGFVNGLTGFGTGLTALGIWLWALPPPAAATLVVVTSVVAQLQTLALVWRKLDVARVWPFVLPGLLAAPLGVAAIAYLDPRDFKLAIGLLLVVYSAASLLHRGRGGSAWGGGLADGCVGLAGGFLGGLAGLSGALLVLWTEFRDLPKDARRGLLQSFNLAVLAVALAAHVAAGRLDAQTGLAVAAALPGTLAGAWLGARVYRRLGDGDYRRIVLVLLLIAGLALCAGR